MLRSRAFTPNGIRASLAMEFPTGNMLDCVRHAHVRCGTRSEFGANVNVIGSLLWGFVFGVNVLFGFVVGVVWWRLCVWDVLFDR